MYVQHKHMHTYINIVRTHGRAIIRLSNHKDVPTGHKKNKNKNMQGQKKPHKTRL